MSESDSQLRIQYVDTPERLNDLDFEDDLAVIEVPANSLRNMPFDVDTAVNEDDFRSISMDNEFSTPFFVSAGSIQSENSFSLRFSEPLSVFSSLAEMSKKSLSSR